ncbi:MULTISPECIES: hypothetical protein [Streptomyces]|uniref:Uncharacterized protein n=1 Tax=Streptomyces mordarskii TaxID=1226758 RepID=A0ABP3NVI0_9ACTN
MSAYDDEFGRMMNEEFPTSPYGAPVQHHKPGLTRRGKAALGIGAAVLAGGGLIGYQAYSADAAANETKAQEIALKQQQLELEKIKELNRASETNRKAQTSENKTRQASINACVKDKDDQVGKEYGSPSYQDVIDACQAQYASTADGDDMESAASSKTANGGGGGVNEGVLLGGGVLVLFLVAAAKKGKRSNPA